jgi:DNA-binding HxlR family transcriptional regulator
MNEKNCVYKTLKFIGAKWTIQILFELFQGTKRFSQLQNNLPGISPKTLALRLSELEKNHLVSKKIFPHSPPHVEYSLTAKGQSLKGILDQMHHWGAQS